MKRFVLSVVCGFVIPFLYSIIVGPLSSYIENDRLKLLVGIPVRWPLFIYPPFVMLPFPILLLYITVCNVFVYGGLSYFALWRLSARKKTESPPPKPPSFVQY